MQNRFNIMLALLSMAFSAIAAEVDLDTARRFAKDWRGKGIRAARTHRNAAGESRFHVVNFEGGGWAAVGADDTEPPVIAFSDNGEDLVEDERNAVWFLVKRDGERRAFARREVKRKGEERKRHKGWEKRKVRRVQGVREAGEVKTSEVKTAASKTTLEDVRVEPLLKSTWNQGSNIYNLYTPNKYVCGCVATMMAQIMRYYEWPKTSVTAKTYQCKWGSDIDTASTMTTGNQTMKGGVYDWSMMLLNPYSNSPESNRQEISKLCYDCGVSVHMQWSGVGSGTFCSLVREALVDTFGYANAHLVVYDYPTEQSSAVFHAYDFEELKTIVISNCEAGLPVGYGISGEKAGGHAVVIDGYGYSSSGDFYMHINPGWSGNSNAWYNPPDLAMGGYAFDESDELVYNIFPEGSGALVTGRVTGPDGEPVAGATVSAIAIHQENKGTYFRPNNVSYTNVLATATTDAKGRYHLKTGVTGFETTVIATVTKGRLFGTATTDLPRSQTMLGSRTNPFNGGYSTNSYSLGNKIDFNIQLENQKIPPRVIFR